MPVAAFLSYIFLTAFTPGPNTLMAMSSGIRAGFSGAMRFCCGVLLGFLFVMSCCAAFTAVLYAYIPALEPVLRWVGAGYIAWLAVCVFRSRPGGTGDAGASGGAGGLRDGMLLQCVNVKVILYGLTAFSTFILPHFQSPAEAVFFVLVLSLVGFAGTVCWAFFGALLQRLFVEHVRAVNSVLAASLLCIAVSLVIPG